MSAHAFSNAGWALIGATTTGAAGSVPAARRVSLAVRMPMMMLSVPPDVNAPAPPGFPSSASASSITSRSKRPRLAKTRPAPSPLVAMYAPYASASSRSCSSPTP
jgi:hypothetical protein